MFIKTPISPVQTAGRKLLQKSVRLLNTPPHKTPIKLPTDNQTPVAKSPLPMWREPSLDVTSKELDIPRPTIKPQMQPLLPQQFLLPRIILLT